MAPKLVKGELLVTGISVLHAPPSSFHLKAVQPQFCAGQAPQLKVPLGPTVRVALVEAVVPCGAPARIMPCGFRPPKSRPPKPAPMAGEPGKSWQARRACAGVTLVKAMPAIAPRF